MSDGPSDCAAMEHDKAMREAKRCYPDLTVVEQNWTNQLDWVERGLAYARVLLKASDKERQPCTQCNGCGTERVVYVHETHIRHVYNVANWPCRKCYGYALEVKRA